MIKLKQPQLTTTSSVFHLLHFWNYIWNFFVSLSYILGRSFVLPLPGCPRLSCSHHAPSFEQFVSLAMFTACESLYFDSVRPFPSSCLQHPSLMFTAMFLSGGPKSKWKNEPANETPTGKQRLSQSIIKSCHNRTASHFL